MSSTAAPQEEEEETVMSSVVKEFQALKEKFKSEDQDCTSRRSDRGRLRASGLRPR